MNIINRNKKRNKTGNPIQVRAQKTRDKSSDQSSKSYRSDSSLHIQRKCADCEKEEQVQRKESGQTGSKMSVSNSVQNSIKSSQGAGSPMAPNTSKFLGEKTGYDFSKVNIHNDERSHGLAHELNAKAFTVGDDIYFGKGEYSPETYEGKKLIAHEAAHVMQQNKDSIDRTLEVRPPGKGEASAFPRRGELIDRLNKVSTAIQYRLEGRVIKYTLTPDQKLSFFDSQMVSFIDHASLIPMRLINAKGLVGGGALLADSFISGYVDLDDLMANDMYSFQSDLLHFLTERFQVKDYDRKIGTNFGRKFPSAHRKGKEAEAKQLQYLFNDPSVKFIYEESKASGAWVNAFKSTKEKYWVFQVIKNTNKAVAGGKMYVKTKDKKKMTIDEFRRVRGTL